MADPGDSEAMRCAAALRDGHASGDVHRVYNSRTAQILGVDKATTDIPGWRSVDMVGKRSLEVIHPDDQGLAIESWAVLATEPGATRRVRIRHRSGNGDWIWFDVAHCASRMASSWCYRPQLARN